MDFDLTEEQKGIQKAAEEFAKGELDKEAILGLERIHQYPFAVLKKACQLGFIGIHYPDAYGGQGYGILYDTGYFEGSIGGCTKRSDDWNPLSCRPAGSGT